MLRMNTQVHVMVIVFTIFIILQGKHVVDFILIK